MNLRPSLPALCGSALVAMVLLLLPLPSKAAAVPVPAAPGFGCFITPWILPIVVPGIVPLLPPPMCLPVNAGNCTALRAAAGICAFWTADQASCNALCNKCGNGTVDDAEQCDDGNLVNGDGCDNFCAYEPLYCCWVGVRTPLNRLEIDAMAADAEYTGYDCSLIDPVLSDYTELDPTIECGCGDGIVDPATEACDLGRSSGFAGMMNRTNRNTYEYGCDNCQLVCGDNNIDTDSYVIDWYKLNGETDWAYGGPLGIYTEVCDDGNDVNNDACDNYCQTCGNNQIDAGEKCDLGRKTTGSSWNMPEYGCSEDCQNWTCSNGILEPDAYVVNDAGTDWEYGEDDIELQEQCDDGNVNEGDGCDRFCQEEYGVCCDVGGAYDTPNQALTKSECDRGDGTFNAITDVNAKPGFENVVTFDLQFGADNSIAERFCAADRGDFYCCSPNQPFEPMKLDPAKMPAGMTDCAQYPDGVYSAGPIMNLATANKACKPVYCEDQNCTVKPKFDCSVGYGLDWMPPASSEHKAVMQSRGFPFTAAGFCQYWIAPEPPST